MEEHENLNNQDEVNEEKNHENRKCAGKEQRTD